MVRQNWIFTRIMCYTKIDKILWWLATMWLVVDSCTGFFLSYGIDMPLSQVYKLFVLFLIAIRLIENRKTLIIVWCSLMYIAFYLLHLSLIASSIKDPLLMLSKFLSLLYLYLYFCFSFEKFPQIAIANSRKVMIVGWWVLAFNIIIGIMGYGVPTYKEENVELGVKGFFFAGNELGGILAVLAPFMFYWLIVRLSGLRLFILYLFVILVGVLIGSKTAILATLLSAIVVPLLYLPIRKKILLIVIGTIIIICLLPFFASLISDSSIGAIERWSYFYNTGGIERLVFSGRDEFWELKKRDFYNSDFNVRWFGMGLDGTVKSVERDHFDTMLTFGYIGLGFVLFFFLSLLIKAVLYRRHNSLIRLVIFSDLLVLCVAFIAGHVWYSAMASIYIALFNAFVFLHQKEKLYEKE